jgi:hypothetical protein
MGAELSTIEKIHRINDSVHEQAEQYHHTRPLGQAKGVLVLPDKRLQEFTTLFGLKDMFTIGALTESTILMTGGTDCGKTTLAKLVMNGLFGSEDVGWHRIDIATDFGADAYADIDFSAITEGRKLSEGLYSLQSFFLLPGLILDEINRAHSAITNKLLHVLDQDMSLPDGRRVKIGVQRPNGTTYQFQISAINEGQEYSGTFDVDKALRRRTTIEIPMDIFQPTALDRLLIQRTETRDIVLPTTEGFAEAIMELYAGVGKGLKLHALAEMFLSYLEGFEYCKHSLNGLKGSVASKNGSIKHVCTQPIMVRGHNVGDDGMVCEFSRADAFQNDLCANVRGITPGVSKNVVQVAKGFALLRATKFVEMMAGVTQEVFERPLSYRIENDPELFMNSLKQYAGGSLSGVELAKAAVEKYVTGLEVERGDIEAAIGFVGYSKIGMAPLWVAKYFQGNRFEAIRSFIAQAGRHFTEGMQHPDVSNNLEAIMTGNATRKQIMSVEGYCQRVNPWLWHTLSPYIANSENGERISEVVDRLYSSG